MVQVPSSKVLSRLAVEKMLPSRMLSPEVEVLVVPMLLAVSQMESPISKSFRARCLPLFRFNSSLVFDVGAGRASISSSSEDQTAFSGSSSLTARTFSGVLIGPSFGTSGVWYVGGGVLFIKDRSETCCGMPDDSE